MSLPEIKKEAESLALNDLGEALEFLRTKLPAESPVVTTVLSMIRRLNRAASNRRKGLISLEDMDIIENQIFDSLLEFLRSLNDEKVSNGVKAMEGKILYDIPNVMAIRQETRCRIRLAFLEEVIRQNLDWSEHMEIHSIQIGEVMSVELVDPAANPVFQIRSISDEVQRIDPDFYSEWWFYVTAQQPGKHTLVLRVSIVEIVDGVDRKRNIVLEEVIDIVESVPETTISTSVFREAPDRITTRQSGLENQIEEVADDAGAVIEPSKKTSPSNPGPARVQPGAPVDVQPAVPPAPAPPPPPPPSPAVRPRSRNNTVRRWLTYTASALVIFASASYAMMPGFRSEIGWWRTADNKEGYVEFLEDNPESHRVQEALEKIEYLDWQLISENPTISNLKGFLIDHPQSKYSPDALEALNEIARKGLTIEDMELYLQDSTNFSDNKGLVEAPVNFNVFLDSLFNYQSDFDSRMVSINGVDSVRLYNPNLVLEIQTFLMDTVFQQIKEPLNQMEFIRNLEKTGWKDQQ